MTAPVIGQYVTGWIKRGPSGVIGTNKACARETVENLLADAHAGRLVASAHDATGALLLERGIEYVYFDGWNAIDRYECELGQPLHRPRIKLTHISRMVAIGGRR